MPGEFATPLIKTPPVPPSDDVPARLLQSEDQADLVRKLAVAPRHVCLGEVLIGPTWNRIYIGSDDMRPAL